MKPNWNFQGGGMFKPKQIFCRYFYGRFWVRVVDSGMTIFTCQFLGNIDYYLENVIDQFRYIKIQPKTKDFSTRLWRINRTNSVVIP